MFAATHDAGLISSASSFVLSTILFESKIILVIFGLVLSRSFVSWTISTTRHVPTVARNSPPPEKSDPSWLVGVLLRVRANLKIDECA